MADFVPNEITSKLMILYLLDKIDIPLTEKSIIDIFTSKNTWLNYMDCKTMLWSLQDVGFIDSSNDEKDSRFSLSYDGRSCLSHYFQRIPASLREEMSVFAKANRINFKRNQEYVSDYVKTDDGLYIITLKINEALINKSIFEIKIETKNRTSALNACNQWREKAPAIYEMMLNNLFEE